jgi:hypothetical protein
MAEDWGKTLTINTKPSPSNTLMGPILGALARISHG